jgi:hypothetical protein
LSKGPRALAAGALANEQAPTAKAPVAKAPGLRPNVQGFAPLNKEVLIAKLILLDV